MKVITIWVPLLLTSAKKQTYQLGKKNLPQVTVLFFPWAIRDKKKQGKQAKSIQPTMHGEVSKSITFEKQEK